MPSARNEDYHDVLAALVDHEVRFLVVGAHALAVHGLPRATVDIDIWIDRTHDNARRVWSALVAFGAPLDALGIEESDFAKPDTVIQLGVPPRRIDILTGVTGLTFAQAWPNRLTGELEGVPTPVIGRQDLISNKRATGRMKDLGDVESLEGRI